MTTLYGISHCDKVRAARKWLETEGIEYSFHDTRKQGLDETILRSWVSQLGFNKVLNRQSTSWRQLPELCRQHIDEEQAIHLMIKSVTLIKRPLLVHNGTLTIGYHLETYRELFS